MIGFALEEEVLPDIYVNPVSKVERYPENYSAHYLTIEELRKVGIALQEGETVGIPWDVDETIDNAKHIPHPANRRTVIDPYASDLSDVIEDRRPALWVHGHTHDTCDYRVGSTRILCNPRGYDDENIAFDPALVVGV